MKTRKVSEFLYTKKDKSTSERKVFIIGTPGNKYFGIDLSEFSEDEQFTYEQELRKAYAVLDETIAELGLSTNYRLFLEEGVLEHEVQCQS